MWFLVSLALVVSVSADLPPSCNKPIFCDSEILHKVQLAQLFNDSKSFVDLKLNQDPNATISAFQALLDSTNNEPTKTQLAEFVDQFFSLGEELEDWVPPDFTTDPKFLKSIRDETLRQLGKDINAIWPTLGRKVKKEVVDNPDRYSMVPVTHGFIIPGGRFTELYYWDTYWIVEGLLISDMKDTAKGVIENLIELLKKLGHIPNGSRWYYQERSQPPLLTAMVSLYLRETRDFKFLKANIDALESEMNYWLDTQVVSFEKDGKSYNMLRYYAPSTGPRPESYREDYNNAQVFDTEERKTEFYIDLKSAAESGWDFSSRWFVDAKGGNEGNLTSIKTKDIIPVDLNAIFANALQNIAFFRALTGNPRKGAQWAYLAKQWRSNIRDVLWNSEAGIWYDYDIVNNKHREYFYPSNISPLWMGAVDKRFILANRGKILNYMRNSQALDFPGGVPTSLIRSGEQWDFPNAWPPEVSIVVNGLEALGSWEAKELAFDVAQVWVRSCLKGFSKNKQMFEKYDAETPGGFGGGGEYTVQAGFGWSNGVVMEFLSKYGRRLTTDDSAVLGLAK